jgi:FKBP-type peptidyl-prolyl cis-trans isomerase
VRTESGTGLVPRRVGSITPAAADMWRRTGVLGFHAGRRASAHLHSLHPVTRSLAKVATIRGNTFSSSSQLPTKAVASRGCLVKVDYLGTLEDGSVFDSSEKTGPLAFAVGEGKMIAGCDVEFAS